MRPLAIELAFDPATDARLGRAWSRLSDLYGGPTMQELGVRPHVTLALFTTDEPRDLTAVVAALARELSAFDLHLATVDRFATNEGVVFLRPSPAPELTHAHARLHDLLGNDRALVHGYYRPGVWHPHCTLAINVPEARSAAVLTACRAEASGTVRVARVQLVRYRPATEVAAACLQDEQKGRTP